MHSTLGHHMNTTISQGGTNNAALETVSNLDLTSNPLISQDNSNFNTTGIIINQSNGSLHQTTQMIQKNATSNTIQFKKSGVISESKYGNTT